MRIIIDTREQQKLIFNHEVISGVIVEKLEVGDYCCYFPNGEKSTVIFERKSVGDLFGSLTKDYPRIKEEIERAKANGITLNIIIEGNLSKVFKGYKFSQVKGISIIKTLFSLWARYNILPIFTKDREEMAEYIIHFYWAEWRKKISKEGA
jgi:ERCC4-type nuclease